MGTMHSWSLPPVSPKANSKPASSRGSEMCLIAVRFNSRKEVVTRHLPLLLVLH